MRKTILSVSVIVVLLFSGALYYLATETRELKGFVHDALTNAPIENVKISIAGFSAVTDAQGQYAIRIPRGKYTLVAESDGYDLTYTELNGDDLFARTFAVDFALQPSRLAITVRDSETQQPISNAQVVVATQSLATNAQGILELRGVKTGTSIAAQMPGYLPTAVVYDGKGDFDLPLAPNTVNVVVTNQYTTKPIVNAKIQAHNQTLTSDTQGRATFRRIRAGSAITATASGFENATAPFTGKDIQFILRPTTFDGTVIDATTNQPISGTLVYFGNNIITTNGKGEFHLDNVPAKASLVLKVPGYRKTPIDISGVTQREIKLTPFLVKGVHLPFSITEERWREIVDLISKTELNAAVIDVKAERGRIMWDSQVPLAKQIGAAYLQGVDLKRVIEDCKTREIYCMARLPVFQDNLLASSRPHLAARLTNGVVFTETGGQQWLNPFLQDNWNYVIALAKEIAAMGFDEIQFDYVRFPGMVNTLAWGTDYNEETRIAAITGFLARAQKELRPTGVFVSADVFGLTTATDDDQHTGQRLRDLGPYLDYISPMVYPDTWVEASTLLSRGLEIKNCAEANLCPYEVIYNSYKRAAEKTTTKVRLWLQAYAGRGNFGVEQYRVQKQAATEAGSCGWMFWNGQGIYDPKMFDGK